MENLDRKLEGVVNKTDITSGTTLASNGKLNAEQFDFMMKQTLDQAGILKDVSKQIMDSPTAELSDFTVADRVLTSPGEVTGITATGITTTKRTLTSVELTLSCHPSYQFMEDNVSQGKGLDQIVEASSVGYWNNIADLGCNGTGTSSGFLSLNAGWPQLVIDESDSDLIYDVPAGTKDFDGTILPNLVAQHNSKYVLMPNKKIYMSRADWLLCLADIAGRQTAYGDAVFQGRAPLIFGDYEIIWRPYWPSDYYMVCDPSNLVLGVQRDMSIEQDKDIEKRYHIIVITARVDFQIINPEAVVLGYDATP